MTDKSNTYGSLNDYVTGEYLRPATQAEREASDAEVEECRNEGVILVDWRAEGGWNGEDFRPCYVQP